ncbi:hypothetical protein [Hippea alviniae]|uniref:hypothetical protein n=1 Tax=Hippea alviniae TaxID=1279027 RepID=UPI0003B3C2F3|nr:hypothetical protein [Hippea alviniae]
MIDFKNNTVQIEDSVLHYLPFLPTRTRQKDYQVIRKYKNSNLMCELRAQESLNVHDLLILFVLLKDYQKNPESWKKTTIMVKRSNKTMEIASKVVSLKEICKTRGIIPKKNNRQTVLNSLRRFRYAEIRYLWPNGTTEYSSYIYNIAEEDTEVNVLRIDVNKRFFDFCLKKGIVINLEYIYKIEQIKDKNLKHYKGYAILLILYMQGTKEVLESKRKKKYFYWRRYYTEEELLYASHIAELNIAETEKRKFLQRSLKILYKCGIPEYKLDKESKIYYRADIKEVNEKFTKIKPIQ